MALDKDIIQASRESHVSWSSLFGAAGIVASVIYGFWALNQSQLANVAQQIEQLRRDTEAKDIRLSSELTRRETELKTSLATIQEELNRRRDEFANIKEFRAAEGRTLDNIEVLRKQLQVLEATRPTTGELQASSAALRDRIDKLYELIRSIEDWIRARGTIPPK